MLLLFSLAQMKREALPGPLPGGDGSRGPGVTVPPSGILVNRCSPDNTLCLLFKHCAVTQLNSIFDKYKLNVTHSVSQLARILRYNLI